MSNELCRLTATEAARQIGAGSLKPAGLAPRASPRSMRSPFTIPRRSRCAAASRQTARHSGGRDGRAGFRRYARWARLADLEGLRPRADSAPVAWTRAIGGVVIGETVTTASRENGHAVGGSNMLTSRTTSLTPCRPTRIAPTAPATFVSYFLSMDTNQQLTKSASASVRLEYTLPQL